MNGIDVRWAAPEDREAWLGLRRALWPDCPEEKHETEVGQALAAEGGALLAHRPGSGAVGFAEISLRHEHVEGASSAPIAYIEGWFVDPGLRGQGVGKLLIEAAAAWAKERGVSEMASHTEVANGASQAAHEALGFQEVGRSVHYLRRL